MDTLRLRGPGLTWRVIDGEAVVLDLDASEYFSVNRSGTVLWERLADGATSTQLRAALVETYGLDGSRAAADVAAFLSSLAARRMLAS